MCENRQDVETVRESQGYAMAAKVITAGFKVTLKSVLRGYYCLHNEYTPFNIMHFIKVSISVKILLLI